jgi:hypothetical protein
MYKLQVDCIILLDILACIGVAYTFRLQFVQNLELSTFWIIKASTIVILLLEINVY